jgi:outer membrane protein
MLLVLTLGATATPARAQQIPNAVIAVVDFSRVVRDSLAGRNVRSQTDQQQAGYQAEIQEFQSELEKARLELTRQQTILSPEAFNRNRQAYEQRARELQRTVQTRKQELDQRFGQGMRLVEEEVVKILRELAAEQGINIVLNATRGGVVVFAEGALVITNDVINRLNERLQTVALPPPAQK